MLSIIIPSYKDPFLQQTINSILENSVEEIEVIPVLDGYWENIKKDPRVKVVHLKINRGTRGAINAGLKVAKGDFVAKIDSHCIIAQEFDKVMCESCAENWLMTPRRYSLNEIKWERNDSRPTVDYHYFNFPVESKYGYGMFAQSDWSKSHHCRKKFMVDDILTMQASCWLVNRKYYMKHVGFLDDRIKTYGCFGGEYIEIGLKYWLGGGAMKVNKNTWYAHLLKRRCHYNDKLFFKKYKANTMDNRTWSSKHWINNEEPNMIHKFEWLIEKFWPIKTWPDNWQEVWTNYKL